MHRTGLDGRHRPESEGLKRAKELGLKTTHEGVEGLEPHIVDDKVQIAWDATSAYVHARTTSWSRSTASRWST